MSGSFEGDLIRPLGLLTLYFGYAEFEVDALIDALEKWGLIGASPKSAPLGQRLTTARDLLNRQQIVEATQVISIIDEFRHLIELRNVLVHSCVLAGGRVIPSDKSQGTLRVTPEQLTKLAGDIFTWKEKLSAARQRQLMPALQRKSIDGT